MSLHWQVVSLPLNHQCVLCLVAQSCLTLWDLINCSPSVSSVHGNYSDKNTGVGCPALLQGIFPTQKSNPGLLHCRWILYCVNHQRSPFNSSVQSLSCVQLFAAPWTAARQASLSITNSQSLSKLMFIESVMPSNPSHPLSPPSSPAFNLS